MEDKHMTYWDMRSGLIPRLDPFAKQDKSDKIVHWEAPPADATQITDEPEPSYLRAASPVGAASHGSASMQNLHRTVYPTARSTDSS